MEEKLNKLRESMNRTVLKNGSMTINEKQRILLKAQQEDGPKESFMGPVLTFIFSLSFLIFISLFIYNQVFDKGEFIMLSINHMFLWLMFIVFVVVGTIFLFLQRENKYFKQYFVAIPTLSIIGVILLLNQSDDSVAMVSNNAAAPNKEVNEKQTSAVEMKEEENLPLNQKIHRTLNEKLYAMTDVNEKRVEEIIVSKDEKEVQLLLGADSMGHMEDIRTKLGKSSSKALRVVFDNKQVDKASFEWQVKHYVGEFREAKEFYEVGLSYELTRADYEKINWDDFSLAEIEKVATKYEIQPFLLENN
ncbi:hypothetical protein SM124_15210 [Bacillus sp. 31A1R]|uniref:Uncharacterized protein n=1 Tax=Robertmurraya mangrovi TaxID=3098077 RepID=A0ABU5J112_9BACI|nr:hypothetical protein [Bacillus sp. 31A1R]MDZ5473066.1 hypothetical protein [Bacillus sp. 31A1R]